MQITQLIDSQPTIMQEISMFINKVTLQELKNRIEEKVFKMLAKLKKQNKQINESVINREDFLEVMKNVDGKGLSESTLQLIQPLVQVNPNNGHIYQAKMVNFLIDEVNAKAEISKDAVVSKTQNGGQVLSFKQLESDDEQ